MRDEVRTRLGRAAKATAVLTALTFAVSGCGVYDVLRFGWPSGVTPQASAMRELWIWSIVAALIVGFLVWGLMLWTIVFHRRRADDDELPRQFQYNMPLEIAYTVIPLVIISGLFAFTVLVQNYVDTDQPDPDVRVNVTAFQWNWEFEYPERTDSTGRPVSTLGTSSEIPIMVLPTDRRIEFRLVSRDVVHSFWVIDFLFKRDVFPRPDKNDTDNVWQIDRIEREGAFVGRCAELCGTYHAFMSFEVRALRPDLFDRYIALRQTVNPATGTLYTTGDALAALNCGQWCAPKAIKTAPAATDRTEDNAVGFEPR